VITRAEIEKSQSAFVSHLLRNVPGVDVVQSGGSGKFTSVFIRGANSHHTLVLLDGVPLNDPSSPNNAADLSNLSTANVERIEFMRGPQSDLFGPEAIGGVIQIFTRSGEKVASKSVSSEGGSFGSFKIAGNLTGMKDRFGFAVSAETYHTNGVSAADGAPEDDGFGNTNLSTQLDLDLNNTMRLNLVGRYSDLESDLDKTSGTLDDPDYITSQKDHLYQARLIRQTPDSKWRQNLSVFYGDVERTTTDDFDQAHPSDSESTITTGERIGVSYQQSIQIDRGSTISLGLETEKVAFTSDLFFRSAFGDFSDNVGERSSWSRGVYFLDQFNIKENLFITVGGRLDGHKQFGSTGTYRVTAAFLVKQTGTRIRGVVASGYKAPSVFQLYHPSPYIGNKDLRPEKSRSWEIGLDQELVREQLTLSLSYFANNFEDLIVGLENVAEATSKGLETAIELKSAKLRTRLDYTFCQSEDKSTGEELIRRPKHKLAISSDYKFGDRVQLNIVARHTGKREDSDFSLFPAQRVLLNAYTVVNLGASFKAGKNLELFSRVENLFDQDYQEVYSYGSVPLSAFAGLRLSN
ncbi:MAG: TonB-dependent receptor plug domain-containing protein, partial [Candidatus Zixiibacteriota bacterium]